MDKTKVNADWWGLLLSLAMLLPMLSGCSGDSPAGPGSPPAGADSPPNPDLAGGGANRAPTGTLSVAAPGEGVPAEVTFGLTGSDADGDALSWTLDANGDGIVDAKADAPASFPATARHTYPAAGLFNVTYTLHDGEAAAVYRTQIAVGPGVRATKTFSGHVIGPDPTNVLGDPTVSRIVGDCVFAAATQLAPVGGVAGDDHPLEEDYAGWAFSFDVPGMVAEFRDSGAIPVSDAKESGTVPSGAHGVYACSKGAVDTDYTLTLVSP